MKRVAVATVLLSLALPATSSAASPSRSCASFRSVVISSGATVSQMTARGVDCATARKVATQWLTGLSRRSAYVYCAPPQGAPSETCTIGRYSCRASGVAGPPEPANLMRCHYGRRTMSWRATFDEQPQDDPEL